jgi:hypothetical protein
MILVGPTIRSEEQAVAAATTIEVYARIERRKVVPDMVGSERGLGGGGLKTLRL